MKKILYFATILFLMLGVVSPAVASPAADEPPPQRPNFALADERIYLPVAVNNNSHASYTVSGRITTDKPVVVTTEEVNGKTVPVFADVPIGSVKVQENNSANQVTADSDGRYQITVRAHSRIQPDIAGYYFLPSYIEVSGDMPLNALNFTGKAAGQAPEIPDAQVLPNPDFEIVPFYWNPISGSANGFTPYYSTAQAHSGAWSGFTGIPLGWWDGWWWGWWVDWQSWSRWRSHEILLPIDTTTATLTAWLWPDSEELTAVPDTAPGGGPAKPENPETAAKLAQIKDALIGQNTDQEINWPFPAIDFQYIAITDVNNNILGVPFITLRDDMAWISTGVIDLKALGFYNRTIKLEFGTYNDPFLYTQAYWDDITLDITTGAVTVACTNILLNSNMETIPPAINSGWIERNAPQTVRPVYSTEYFWSPTHSLKTGLAPWDAIPTLGVWPWGYANSTTEAYQPFTIPANAFYANLSFLVKPRSNGWWGWWSADGVKNMQGPTGKDVALRTDAPDAPDQQTWQYGYIADSGGVNGLWNLFKWWSVDSYSWYARSYDLWLLRGQPFSVLFGVGNMNHDNPYLKNVLYTDDVTLTECHTTP